MSNTLSFELNKTAAWRQKKAERHQEDVRNASAVQELGRLASQGADDALARRYDVLIEDEELDASILDQARSDVLADIGFGFRPCHVDEVLARILDRVTAVA